MPWQESVPERLEETAFCLGRNIPIQLYGDFKEGRVSEGFMKSRLQGGYAFANLRELFPNHCPGLSWKEWKDLEP